MLDIKTALEEAKAEVQEEALKAAKAEIKASLRRISNAEEVLAQARRDHEVLIRTIGGG